MSDRHAFCAREWNRPMRKRSPHTSGWIDVMADGYVIVRADAVPAPGSLPCYDAGSEEMAWNIVAVAYVRTFDGQGYELPDFEVGELKAIGIARLRFEECHRIKRRRREARGPLR